MNTRIVINQLLETYESHPQSIDTIFDRCAQVRLLDPRDRRFAMEIVFGIVRRKLTLDFLLDHFLQTDRLKNNNSLMRILKIGAYQILFMDRVPDHASVNETVKLAKENSYTADCAGVVNAVLRNIIKSKARLPKPAASLELSKRLSIEYSHPEWMVKRWLTNLGLSRTKALMTFNNTRPEIFLRRKIKGLSRPQFDNESKSISEPVRGTYMNLFYHLRKAIIPESIILLQDGYCTVQAPSSGWIVALLEPASGDTVLDVCSAPGGKAGLISEMVGDKGRVCAGDLKMVRLAKVVETARRMSLANMRFAVCDGTGLPFKRQFNRVLLDAPCSSSGVFHKHPDARWNREPDNIPRLASLQSRLLDGAAVCVKKGGTLVYSTCSVEPEENELQVRSFLERHPEFTLEKPPSAIPAKYVSNDGFLTITPYEHKEDGMFGARMKRVK
jgi:16S rRNA (cytosine967-C5)-methyltransferase